MHKRDCPTPAAFPDVSPTQPLHTRARILTKLSVHALLALFLAVSTPSAQAGDKSNAIERTAFGRLRDGTPVEQYTLVNARGLRARVITYGAIITELSVPDRNGKFISVVHGSDQLASYKPDFPAAAVMGRVANRIAHGRFTLDGQRYQLSATSAEGHHIHGGRSRFDRVVWRALPTTDQAAVTLTHASPDGADGYPGTVNVAVTYTLTDDDTLRITYEATTDRATPINLTQHAYFNLSDTGDLPAHVLTINSTHYTPFTKKKIPTGEITPVKDTPFDFTHPTTLATALARTPNYSFDQNYVLKRDESSPGSLAFAARLHDPVSGRTLEAWTTEPGLQLLTRLTGSGGKSARQGHLCLETQHFPDSVNHPHFPSTILRPGETFRSVTEYRFSTH
jgi:aldose 1-epimerase